MGDANFSGSPLMRFFFSRIFPWPFILVGVGLMCAGAVALFRAQASTQWPTVEGKVIDSEVERNHGGDGTQYEAEVHYQYVVKGTTYNSNRVAFGSIRKDDPSDARMVVNRYPKGATVTVSYSPNDPTLSVLEPGIHGAALLFPAFGLLFFLAGCAIARFLPRIFRLIVAAEAAAKPGVAS